MDMTTVSALIAEISAILGLVIPVIVCVRKVSNGQKCLLRSDMLAIYYKNRGTGKIRQYEYENFVMLYEAYKALKGNSFIDKIYEEVHEWDIIS
jgi:hypothetical protein